MFMVAFVSFRIKSFLKHALGPCKGGSVECGEMARACNLSTWVAEGEESGVQRQCWLHSRFGVSLEYNMALYIKGKIKEGRGREGRKDRRDEEREEETAHWTRLVWIYPFQLLKLLGVQWVPFVSIIYLS